MSQYSVVKITNVDDPSGDYPAELKPLKKALGTEQVAITYRRLPQETGSIKGSKRGHRHKTQEEVIFVIRGTLTVKLEDELVEVGPKAAIRISPGVAQDLWNFGPEEVELLIISTYLDNLMDDLEIIPDFWPPDKD